MKTKTNSIKPDRDYHGRFLPGSAARRTHGHAAKGKRSPSYLTWMNLVQRCTNPNREDYPRYGGRGITVCKRWRSFANFLRDMGCRPEGMSIHRLRNDRGYSKGNVRWATPEEQARNRRPRRAFRLNPQPA